MRLLVMSAFAGTLLVCSPQVRETAAEPNVPSAIDVLDQAVVTGVRGTLQTLHVDEKDIQAGFAVPLGWGSWTGTARATGTRGPRGHELWEVFFVEGGHGVGVVHKTLEIEPS